MNKAVRLIKDYMLPMAIVLGISLYLVYHFTPAMHRFGPWLHPVVSEGQRLVIAILLFFQFVKISPHDLKLSRWHLGALLVQVLSFLVLALLVAVTPQGDVRMLLECAMLCMICPTASAAGVITDRLGGNLAGTVTYVVMINAAGTFLIPLVIPLVNPSSDLGFWAYVGHIALKVFPVLILPGLVAWVIRYTTHKLQRRLMRWSSNSFYVWGVGLTLAMILATRALLLSSLGMAAVAGIVLVSAFCCFVQFFAGRRMGKDRIGSLTAGQALGQKNTGFLIWLGYNYMTPVTSVAGGLYAIWQNLFNSWELYRKEHPKG
ncbi:MAG: bile acid:sodium symporter [Bacteroidales bacterium]|nr:bile acid:sodium symporter [Bacteroidales bacterium]